MALGTPIESLLIAVDADLSGITRGLASARTQLDAFTKLVTQSANPKVSLTLNADPAIRQAKSLAAQVAAVRKQAEAPIALAIDTAKIQGFNTQIAKFVSPTIRLTIDTKQASAQLAQIDKLIRSIPPVKIAVDTSQLLGVQKVLDGLSGKVGKQGSKLPPLTWDISRFEAAATQVLGRFDEIQARGAGLREALQTAITPVVNPVPSEQALGGIAGVAEAVGGRVREALGGLQGTNLGGAAPGLTQTQDAALGAAGALASATAKALSLQEALGAVAQASRALVAQPLEVIVTAPSSAQVLDALTAQIGVVRRSASAPIELVVAAPVAPIRAAANEATRLGDALRAVQATAAIPLPPIVITEAASSRDVLAGILTQVGALRREISSPMELIVSVPVAPIQSAANAVTQLGAVLREIQVRAQAQVPPITVQITEAASSKEVLAGILTQVGAVRREVTTPMQLIVAAPVAPITQAANQATVLGAALQRVQVAAKALAATPPLELVATAAQPQAVLDALTARIGVVRREVSTPMQLIVAPPPPIPVPPPPVIPPVVIPPPVPPDFSATIREAQAAARATGAEFDVALRRAMGGLSVAAFDEARSIGAALEAGLVRRIAGLGHQVADRVISPEEFVRRVDIALAEVGQEIRAKIASLPVVPIRVKTVVERAGAAAPNVISEADLDSSEKQFGNVDRSAASATKSINNFGAAAIKGTHGVRGLASTTAVLAAQSLGASGPVGTLAQNAIFLSSMTLGAEKSVQAIGLRIAGVAVIVLAAAKVYEFLTTAEREAKAANDALVTGLLAEAAAANPAEKAMRGLTAAIEAQAVAREKLASVPEQITAGVSLVPFATALAVPLANEQARRDSKAFFEAQKAAKQATEDLNKAVSEGALRNAQAIVPEIQARIISTDLMRQAPGLVKELIKQEQDVSRPMLQRLAIHQALLDLQGAMNQAVVDQNALQEKQNALLQARVQPLAEAPGLGVSTAGVQQQIAAELARNRLIKANSTNLKDVEQAQKNINALLEGGLAPLSRQADLTQASAQAQLTLLQRLQTQAAVLGATPSLTVDVSDAVAGLAKVRETVDATIGRLKAQQASVKDSTSAFDSLTAKIGGLERLRDAIDDAAKAANPGRLVALVASIGPLTERLTALRGLTADNAQGERLAAGAAELLATKYGQLAAAVAAAGGAASADTRLLSAQAAALQGLGPSLGPFLGALGEAGRQVRGLVDQTDALAFIRVPPLTLGINVAPARATLEQFQRETAERAAVQASLELDVSEAATALAEFKRAGGGTIEELVRFEADLTQAQAKLNQFRIETEQRKATIVIDAKLDQAQREVNGFFDLIIKRQREQDAGKLGNIQLPTVGALEAGFDKAQASVEDLNDKMTKAAAASNKTFRKIKADVDDTRTAAQKLADTLDRVSSAIGGLQSIGNQLGIVDEKTNHFLDALGEASHAAAQFASGDVLGGIVSGLGSIASLGQGLFGKSADQKAAEAAIHDNTAALRENTKRRSEGFTGLGGAASAAEILRQVIASATIQVGVGVGSKFSTPAVGQTQAGGEIGRDARNALVREAAALGLSFTDLQRLADDFGITILEKGKLVGGSLEQLVKEIDASNQAQLRFKQTLDDQVQAASLRARITGAPDDAAAQFQREIAAAGSLGASAITDIFKGITPADSDQFRNALLKLLDGLQAGTLDAKKLGKLSRDDIIKILNDGASALENFRNKTDEAAKSIGDFNLPVGFRRAALAFQNSAVGPIPPPLPPPPVLKPLPFTPPLPAGVFPGTDGADLPAIKDLLAGIATSAPNDLLDAISKGAAASPADIMRELSSQSLALRQIATASGARTGAGVSSSKQVVVNVHPGAIVIHQQPGQSGQDAADAALTGLRGIAMQQSGDSIQIGKLF